MASNQHQVVTFNEGEPLDPVKLNKLASNIDNLYKMQSVANQTNDAGNPAVPIIFQKLFKFEDVGAGSIVTEAFNFGSTFTESEIKSGKIHAVAGVRNGLTKDDNITVSIASITTNPTVYVVNKGKKRNIYVDVIAIYLKEVTTGS